MLVYDVTICDVWTFERIRFDGMDIVEHACPDVHQEMGVSIASEHDQIFSLKRDPV